MTRSASLPASSEPTRSSRPTSASPTRPRPRATCRRQHLRHQRLRRGDEKGARGKLDRLARLLDDARAYAKAPATEQRDLVLEALVPVVDGRLCSRARTASRTSVTRSRLAIARASRSSSVEAPRRPWSRRWTLRMRFTLRPPGRKRLVTRSAGPWRALSSNLLRSSRAPPRPWRSTP